MNVSTEVLQKIAHLARLNFDESNAEQLSTDLNKIINWIDQLKEVDTSHVAPLTHISTEINCLREDQVEDSLDHDKGLFNAPKKDVNYFRVPKVLD